jgi:hypothetical protein
MQSRNCTTIHFFVLGIVSIHKFENSTKGAFFVHSSAGSLPGRPQVEGTHFFFCRCSRLTRRTHCSAMGEILIFGLAFIELVTQHCLLFYQHRSNG